MKKILTLILMMVFIQIVNAQHLDNYTDPSLITPSLIDFSKLEIGHTVSFASGFSSNKNSFYQSMYTNHLLYKFSPKLKLAVDLNFANYGTASHKGGLNFEGNNDNTSQIFPEFSLQYQPSDKTSITIEYRRISPYSLFPYNRNW